MVACGVCADRFMWQMCGYIPTCLAKEDSVQVPLMAAKLTASFVLETLIHAKEKVELLTVSNHTTLLHVSAGSFRS